MAKRTTRFGSTAAVHHARAATALASARSLAKRGVRAAARGECNVALESLMHGAMMSGQTFANRDGEGRRKAHFTGANLAIRGLMRRVEACYTKQKIKAVLKAKGSR